MSTTLSYTETVTFTLTHAKYIASKVVTDLKRIQRFYGAPSDDWIHKYETEMTELLKNGYLGTVTYGFQRNSEWIEPTIRYTARDLAGGNSDDDDPGKIRPNASIENASFTSYLTYSSTWDKLNETQRDSFKKSLPFYRGGAPEPGVSGYINSDKSYSAGGQALDRSTVRSFQ